MTIEFNSDNTVAGKGFKATYTHSKLFDDCKAFLVKSSNYLPKRLEEKVSE